MAKSTSNNPANTDNAVFMLDSNLISNLSNNK